VPNHVRHNPAPVGDFDLTTNRSLSPGERAGVRGSRTRSQFADTLFDPPDSSRLRVPNHVPHNPAPVGEFDLTTNRSLSPGERAGARGSRTRSQFADTLFAASDSSRPPCNAVAPPRKRRHGRQRLTGLGVTSDGMTTINGPEPATAARCDPFSTHHTFFAHPTNRGSPSECSEKGTKNIVNEAIDLWWRSCWRPPLVCATAEARLALFLFVYSY
jgi:hypothetical protein